MSRTYRRSPVSDRWKNIESYQEWVEICPFHSWNKNTLPEIFGVEHAKDYFKYFRDGKPTKWTNYGFKEHAKKELRIKSKRAVDKLKKDIDCYDEMEFPTEHDFEYLIWVYD